MGQGHDDRHGTHDSAGSGAGDEVGRKPTAQELAAIFGDVRSARLALRRPRAEDGEAMFRIHGDPETNRYNPARTDPDLATSVRALEEWLRQWDEDGYSYWAVTLRQSAEVLGFGGVRRFAWRDGDVLNLYYRFSPGAWGHGYATEMARAAVHLARMYVAHLPVIARVRAENVPSWRVAERAGLIRRPDLDTAEHMVYALGWPNGA